MRASAKNAIDPEPTTLYRELFRAALRIRLVEERIVDLYPADKIQSPVHLSIGQEAVAVGVCRSIETGDWVFSSYRCHAYFLAKGGDLGAMFAELYGKLPGGAKGKGGSMHLTAPEVGLMGSSAVVASTIPHGVGAAYASRIKRDGKVHVVVFGDGATDEGVYHECLNFAALHKLAVVFVCENNGYAIHSPRTARHSYDIRTHAAAYGIPVAHVADGHDLLKIHEEVSPLVDRARNGEGPQFIEIETCRYKEHVGPGDDFAAGYRPSGELERWQARDPLVRQSALVEQFRPDIEREIDAAVAFAETSPWPGRDQLLTDVDRPDPEKTAATRWAVEPPKGSTRVVSYRGALLHCMRNGLARNPRAVIVGQGVDDHRGTFGTTLDLHKEFGAERVFDTPIAEEGMTGVALGAAINGLYPIQTHIRADFMLAGANQLINLIAKYRYMFGGRFQVPMLIRAMVGRSWGQGAQHSQSFQSLFSHIPGLTVIMPANAQAILETYPYVIEHYPGPVISFEHRLLYDLEFEVDWDAAAAPRMPLTSRKLRDGNDVTIVATSIMVLEAQRAARHVAETFGIDCEIIDLNCISHPDETMILESVAKTGKLIVADTSWLPFGVSSEVCRLVCERAPHSLKSPVISLGQADCPCPTAKTLEDMYYPAQPDFVDAIARLVMGRPDHGVPLPDEKSMADVYKRFKGPF